MPEPGTAAWAAWHLEHTFKPDDAVIIEWLCTWTLRHQRVVAYAQACHTRGWAGWQAVLVWSIVEHTCEPLGVDDDIPF